MACHPQIEIVQAAVQRGIKLSNDSLLTFQRASENGLGPSVAITGSSGKTTTTTLTGLMLEASGLKTHVGGNIVRLLLDRMDEIQRNEPMVIELSSFQLELFNPAPFGSLEQLGPDVAAITNITPNHLDRHPSMAAYAAAKFNLLGHLRSRFTGHSECGWTLLPRDCGLVGHDWPKAHCQRVGIWNQF